MLLTTLGAAIVVATIFFVIAAKAKENNEVFVGIAYSALVIAGFLLFTICIMAKNVIPEANIIDKKIAMYEEENSIIKERIEDVVNGYMEYENGVIDKVLDAEDGAVTLVSLFPELKSDTLVQKQLEVFFANNEKIKELKAQKIDLSMKKFIIYFGK